MTSCAKAPVIHVNADTYCEKSRHISADEAQIDVFRNNWAVMKSYALQIVSHNETYDENCLQLEGTH